MGIKRMIKSIIIIIAVFLVIYMAIFNSKYVWRLFGFMACEEPKNVIIRMINTDNVTGDIHIRGEVNEIEKYYTGYTKNIQGDVMRIGLKFNKFYGYEYKDNNFDLTIPCGNKNVKTVYLTNGVEDIKIWPVGG